ncbi:MAG: TIGR01777 family oxidoreductase [Paludibacter sp.]|nr:TIGR01777 family oxidoreductase [Paludibacter sp.]
MKKIVIAGGTGFIGSYLADKFNKSGYKVLTVSRNPEFITWKPIDLQEAFEGAELIINLAGKSINCRLNEVNRKEIIDSRINTTMWIGNAILACKNPPKLWINASAAGIYRPSLEHSMTEDENELGNDFLAEVVKKWEKVFFEFKTPGTRQIALRTSVVLGRNGGALQPLILLGKLGLAGKQGKGNQMFSWIHLEDYFKTLLFLTENESINGIINCTSPDPVSNTLLMEALRKMLHVPFGIPAPEFAIKLGTKLIGIDSGLILNSSFISPKRLLDNGFKFSFPSIEFALDNLLK